MPGELVEPVQLQVVCRTLWSSLPPDVKEIGEADLARIGSVSDVLSNYYSEAVASRGLAGGIGEHELRERLEAAFITPVGNPRHGRRRAARRSPGIPAAAINELEARHLVRAEWRAGARWFELTHDSLIRPIVSSNAKLREQRQRRRERRLTRAVAGLVALAGLLVAFLVFGRDEKPAGQAVKAPKVGVIEARAPLAGLRLTRELRASAPPVAMSSTAGGRGLLLAGTDGRVRVWDVNLGSEIKTLDYGDTGISSVDVGGGAIVAAGALGTKYWLSAEDSGRLRRARVENRGCGDEQDDLCHRRGRTEVCLRADGSRPARRPRRARRLRIAVPWRRRKAGVLPEPHQCRLQPERDCGTRRRRRWDGQASRSRERWRIPHSRPRGIERILQAPGKFVSAAFSATGGQIVTASDDGTARCGTALTVSRAPCSRPVVRRSATRD